MAVLFKKEEDKDKEGQQGAAQPQVLNSGETATAQAGSAPAPAQPTQSASPQASSGRFTNLRNYINANRNFNAQGGGLGGKVASNLETQGKEVGGKVTGAVQEFGRQREQKLSPLQQGAQLTQQAVSNPMQFVQNQQNVQSLQAARDAEYTGPRGLQDLEGDQSEAALRAKTQGFSERVKQGQTEQGRFNLLRGMFGKPSYSQGQQNLDNLLIQGQRDQVQRIANTGRDAARVQRELALGSQRAAQEGAQAVQEANTIRQQTRDALSQRAAREQTDIQNRLVAAQKEQDANLYRLVSGLQSGNLDQETANKFGISPGQRIFNTNLTNLLSSGAIKRGMDPSAQAVADETNYANIAALRTLTGDPNLMGAFSDPKQAGKFNTSPIFDRNIFDASVREGQAKYNEGLKNIVDDYVNRQIDMARAQGIDPNLGAYDSMRKTLLDQISAINPEDISKERLRQGVFAAGRPAELMAERIKQLQQQTGALNRLNVSSTPTSVDDYEKINNFLQTLGLGRRTENT